MTHYTNNHQKYSLMALWDKINFPGGMMLEMMKGKCQ